MTTTGGVHRGLKLAIALKGDPADGAPPLPRGWAVLHHGTNLDRWPEDPRSVERVTLTKPLSLVENFEYERANGTGTVTNYGRPRNEEAADKDLPIEIRVLFFADPNRRGAQDPKLNAGLDESKRALIRRIYSFQGGRHPGVPSGETLVRVRNGLENGRPIVYFVPERVHADYIAALSPGGVKALAPATPTPGLPSTNEFAKLAEDRNDLAARGTGLTSVVLAGISPGARQRQPASRSDGGERRTLGLLVRMTRSALAIGEQFPELAVAAQGALKAAQNRDWEDVRARLLVFRDTPELPRNLKKGLEDVLEGMPSAKPRPLPDEPGIRAADPALSASEQLDALHDRVKRIATSDQVRGLLKGIPADTLKAELNRAGSKGRGDVRTFAPLLRKLVDDVVDPSATKVPSDASQKIAVALSWIGAEVGKIERHEVLGLDPGAPDDAYNERAREMALEQNKKRGPIAVFVQSLQIVR